MTHFVRTFGLLMRPAYAILLSAIILASPFLSVAQETAEHILVSGQAAFTEGRYSEAAGAFEKFIKDYGQSEEAQKAKNRLLPLLAASYLQTRNPVKAEPIIKEYLTSFPKSEAVQEMAYWLGLAQYQQNRFLEAKESWIAFLAQHPDTPQGNETRLLAATCLFQAGRFDEAAAAFEKLPSELSPPDPAIAQQAELLRLQCLLQAKRLPEAFELLKKTRGAASRVGPSTLLALQSFQLGDYFYEAQDWGRAWQCYLFIPVRDHLLEQQSKALASIEAELESEMSKSTGLTRAREAFLRQTKDRLNREREQLEKATGFDESRHLRVAQCALQTGRPWEAWTAAQVIAEKQPRNATTAGAHYLAALACVESKRWEALQERAEAFAERYPGDPRAAQLSFLEASAYWERSLFKESHEKFAAHHAKFPSFQQADRALFLSSYCALFLEKYAEASVGFAKFKTTYKKSVLLEQAYYWDAMGAVFAKNYPEVRTKFDACLKAFPQGGFQGEALYRKAASEYAEKKYGVALKQLTGWLKRFPDHPLANEVRALAGDAAFAEGEIESGIAFYRAVGRDGNRPLYEYAQFQIGKALKALEKFDDLVGHFKTFAANHPDSPRIVEAFHWIGWGLRRTEKISEARKLYEAAIDKFGNDRDNLSVEDLLCGYAKLFSSPEEKSACLSRLAEREAALSSSGQKTLAARLAWLTAQMVRKSDPDKAKACWERLASYPPKTLSPLLTIEVAEFLVMEKRAAEAEVYFVRYTEAFPKNRERDRVWGGWGLVAAEKGDSAKALECFKKFEEESGNSRLMPKVLETRAKIYIAQKRHKEAVADLERILQIPAARGLPWVTALFRLGEIHDEMNAPDKAIPYYQRIYVMYQKYREWVAKAYLASGISFEKLNRDDEAMRTYQELLGMKDLADFDAFQKAEKRMAALK